MWWTSPPPCVLVHVVLYTHSCFDNIYEFTYRAMFVVVIRVTCNWHVRFTCACIENVLSMCVTYVITLLLRGCLLSQIRSQFLPKVRLAWNTFSVLRPVCACDRFMDDFIFMCVCSQIWICISIYSCFRFYICLCISMCIYKCTRAMWLYLIHTNRNTNMYKVMCKYLYVYSCKYI